MGPCVVMFGGTVMCYPGRRKQRFCVYTTYIIGDKSPTPSRPSRIYPELRDYETAFSDIPLCEPHWPAIMSLYDFIIEIRYRSELLSPVFFLLGELSLSPWKDSGIKNEKVETLEPGDYCI